MAAVWEPTKSTMSRGSQAAAIRARKREMGTLRGYGPVALFSTPDRGGSASSTALST